MASTHKNYCTVAFIPTALTCLSFARLPPNGFRSRCSYAERKCATATKGSILRVAGYFLHEPKDALRTVAANESRAVNDRKLSEYNLFLNAVPNRSCLSPVNDKP